MIPSRIERTHGKFAIAFGVDHVTGGPFGQVWLAPIHEQEGALVIVDNLGLRPSGRATREARVLFDALYPDFDLGERVILFIEAVRARFEQAAVIDGNHDPNVDWETLTGLFVLFGFDAESIGREVLRAFD